MGFANGVSVWHGDFEPSSIIQSPQRSRSKAAETLGVYYGQGWYETEPYYLVSVINRRNLDRKQGVH